MKLSNHKGDGNMLLNEKISIIRKMNNLSQESFAEELGISRQAVSKWENGTSIPDVQMLLRIAEFYNITLDQLVRDEFDLPMTKKAEEKLQQPEEKEEELAIEDYLGKICDVSMNSFRFSVIRNVKIVGRYGNMICFEKGNKYGYFNIKKSLGIVVKKAADYDQQNELVCGACTVYANKGTYFGGMTYAFSTIEKVTDAGIEVHTGKFVAQVSWEDLSVILMKDKK